MPKKTVYCSLTPEFPKEAYVVYLFILHEGELIGIVPLDPIFTSSDAASEGVFKSIEQFESAGNGITIPEECLLIPITYDTDYPLRKEFWTKPTMTYNSQSRMSTFAPVLDHPEFYSLLVTPYAYDDKIEQWYLHAALPFKQDSDISAIEQFMLTSDHVVEPRAKLAAIYKMHGKLRFNWQTKEIRPFDKTPKKLLQMSN